MDVAGRRVLVTGASKGIGELTARAFAAKGAHVAVAARSGDKLKRLAEELGGLSYEVDLSDADQVDGFIDQVELDGPLDVLVNNAALEDFTLMDELDVEVIDRVVALNLATPLKLTSQAVARMLERGSGHIVQVSSMAGVICLPGGSVYSATKAGLNQATACLELELKGTGVATTTVLLGGVDTDMGQRAMSAETVVPLLKRFKTMGLDRLCDPIKVADLIVRAVTEQKRFVVYPPNSLPMAGLVNAPRRIMDLIASGISFR